MDFRNAHRYGAPTMIASAVPASARETTRLAEEYPSPGGQAMPRDDLAEWHRAVREQIDHLGERLGGMEPTLRELHDLVSSQSTVKDWYSTVELANLLDKAEFTVREWCRRGRIHAQKKV